MAQEFDDAVVTVMDSGVSISFRNSYSIYVPKRNINRSSLLRQKLENFDTSVFFTLSILKFALVRWLKGL